MQTVNRAAARVARRLAAMAAFAGLAVAAAAPAAAQDYQAMINQSMARMNQIIANGQNQVNQVVQQRMQDPQVQAAYQQHLARAQQTGQRPYDFPTFTYYYVATRGFSADGVAHLRGVDQQNQAKERAAWQGLQQAQAARGAAQQQWMNGYSANQQEAGRQLMGNSTFQAANGATAVLPHTWQANTTHNYQGNTYHVDQSGQYWVHTGNGYWAPLQR